MQTAGKQGGVVGAAEAVAPVRVGVATAGVPAYKRGRCVPGRVYVEIGFRREGAAAVPLGQEMRSPAERKKTPSGKLITNKT